MLGAFGVHRGLLDENLFHKLSSAASDRGVLKCSVYQRMVGFCGTSQHTAEVFSTEEHRRLSVLGASA